MAYSTAELDTIIRTLEQGIASGAASVSFEGRSMVYRTVDQIRSAIAYFSALYDNASDAPPQTPKTRTFYGYGGNGIGF